MRITQHEFLNFLDSFPIKKDEFIKFLIKRIGI